MSWLEAELFVDNDVVVCGEFRKSFEYESFEDFGEVREEADWSVAGWISGRFSSFVEGDDFCKFPRGREML